VLPTELVIRRSCGCHPRFGNTPDANGTAGPALD
jgi:hypothetical protein